MQIFIIHMNIECQFTQQVLISRLEKKGVPVYFGDQVLSMGIAVSPDLLSISTSWTLRMRSLRGQSWTGSQEMTETQH